eukprot:NODE_104_length_19952_cov_0.449000.p10 type:complete len:242 gc:universal NODE_104_length_19952_cov_0.449000:3183-2458(-)
MTSMASTGLQLLKNMKIFKSQKGFQILAKDRPLKINNREILVPFHAEDFAQSLLVEWNMLKELKPSRLPLSQLYSRALDLKVINSKNECTKQLLDFFKNDALCFTSEFPSNLKDLQEIHANPLLIALRKKFNLKLPTTNTLFLQSNMKDADAIEKILSEANEYELAAIERSALTAKSLLIGLSLCKGMIEPAKAATLARLETIAQIEWFGEVEDNHDVDEEYVVREMNGVKLFLNSFTKSY